ncbi:MAG: c-type cytochrome [Taibaiella sp.]|nr:c-type cytochrome [Taibaiella sp.]
MMCIAAVAGGSAFDENLKEVNFVIPKGWPKPVYNLNRNKPTTSGFMLGRKLFFDPMLSRDGSTSCASCHTQFSGFTHVDHNVSHGINGLKGTRNALVLFNLAWNKSFMWDGGVNNLEVQPLGPITSPVEMNNTLENIIKYLDTSINYKTRFYKTYGDSSVTGQRILKALAQFTCMFESYNSKYDKVMRKEQGVEFTTQELNGYKLFRKNCESCHKEPLFTDYSFKNIGLPVDSAYFDIGRMKITGDSGDSLKFKVPTLRNIEVSYPYMHDGRFRSLKQVLNHYSSGTVLSATVAKEMKDGMFFTENEKTDIIAFLLTLSDKEFLLDLRFRNYRD